MTIRENIIKFVQENSKEKPVCAVCGSEDREIVSMNSKFNIPINNIICKKCGLIYIFPRLSKKDYFIFYKKFYRALYQELDLEKEFINEQELGKKIIGLLKYLDFQFYKKKILDFGAGPGGCLEEFRKQGCDVCGYEIDEKCVKFGSERKINLKNGGLESIKGKFDLIILSNIIEHLNNPVKDLKVILRHLKKKGYIFITNTGIFMVPYYYSYDLDEFFQIAHPYTFSEITEKNLIKLAGLKAIDSDESIFILAKKNENDKNEEIVSDYDRIKKLIIKCKGKKFKKLRKSFFEIFYNSYTLFLKLSKLIIGEMETFKIVHKIKKIVK